MKNPINYKEVCKPGLIDNSWFVCYPDGSPHCGPYSTKEQAQEWIDGLNIRD